MRCSCWCCRLCVSRVSCSVCRRHSCAVLELDQIDVALLNSQFYVSQNARFAGKRNFCYAEWVAHDKPISKEPDTNISCRYNTIHGPRYAQCRANIVVHMHFRCRLSVSYVKLNFNFFFNFPFHFPILLGLYSRNELSRPALATRLVHTQELAKRRRRKKTIFLFL